MKTGNEWKDKLKDLAGIAALEDRIAPEVEEEVRSVNEEVLRSEALKMFGKRFADVTIDNYEVTTPRQQEVKTACKEYINNIDSYFQKGIGILFVGKTGTGKSHLAYAILKEAMRKKYRCNVSKFIEISREIKTSWNSRDISEKEVITRFAKYDFLLIEEIGVQYNTPNEKVILYDILEQRYMRQLPTLLTSNLAPDKLKEHLDFDGEARVWSRVRGSSIIKYFDWEDYRNGQLFGQKDRRGEERGREKAS